MGVAINSQAVHRYHPNLPCGTEEERKRVKGGEGGREGKGEECSHYLAMWFEVGYKWHTRANDVEFLNTHVHISPEA